MSIETERPEFVSSASGVFQRTDLEKLSKRKLADSQRTAQQDLDTTQGLPRTLRPKGNRFTHTLRFFKNPSALLEDAREQCGDIFELELLGMGRWVFLCSPSLVQEMYRTPREVLAAGVVNQTFLGSMLGERTLLNLEGEEHRKRRRKIFPLFNGNHAFSQVSRIRRITDDMLDGWPLNEPFSLLQQFDRLVLRSVMQAIFGSIGVQRTETLCDHASAYFTKGLRSKLAMMPSLQKDLGPWSPWGRVLGLQRQLFATVDAEIEDCQRNPGRGGLLDQLLRDLAEDNQNLSSEDLRHEICTLAFGAVESSPKLLSWTVLDLFLNPSVLQRLRAELDQQLGDRPITRDDLDHMPYLEAVVYEGMRHRPSTSTAGIRKTLRPMVLGGHRLPAGVIVTQCLSEISKTAGLFENHREFDPEHFYHRNGRPNDWKPFGGGHRKCVGEGFALMHLKVILATLVQRVDLELVDEDVKVERMGFFMTPDGGGRVRMRRRWDWGERPRDEPTPSASASSSQEPSEGHAEEHAAQGEDAAGCPFAHLH